MTAAAAARSWRPGGGRLRAVGRNALVPVGVTAVLVAIYLIDALAIHPGSGPAACPVGGTAPLVRWDSGWYLYIALAGYHHIAGQEQQATAFFPLLPWLMRAVHAVVPALSLVSAAIVVNVAAITAAMVFVDRALADWPAWQRAATVALLLSIPGAFFYVTVYSEALFALGTAIVVWAVMRPGRLAWAPAGVIIAGSDRVIGGVLLLALGIILWLRRDQVPLRQAVPMLAAAAMGLVVAVVYGAVSSGEALWFLTGRRGFSGPGGVGYLPYTVRHGLAATLSVIGEEATGSTVDQVDSPALAARTLPWSAGLYLDLLVIPLVALTLRARRELGVLALATATVTLAVAPIVSQARFILVLLPVWIGAVAALRGWWWGWALVTAAGLVGLAVNLRLVADFANCNWAG